MPILGCVILGFGIFLRVDSKYSAAFSDIPYLHTGAYLLIFIGLVVMITGFLGCCGALRESQCMLFSFFLILFFIFIVLMAAGIWAIASKTKMKNEVREYLIGNVEAYRDDSEKKERKKAMDLIQKEFECCGVRSKSDYGLHGVKVPESCGTSVREKIAREGCYEAVIQYGQDNLITVAGIGIGIGLIMIIGMSFSIILCCAIRDRVR